VKSVLIAVEQANTEPWLSIWKNGQEKTWIKDNVKGSRVIHFASKNAPYLVKKFDEIHEKIRYRKTLGLWQGRLDKITTKFFSRKIPKYIFSSESNTLSVNSWSTYYFFGQRNIALYDWFLKNASEDFLFVTNTSSYINQRKLLDIVQMFNPTETVYAGYLLPENGKEQFVSGAGRLLSRRSVELIKLNWNKHTHETLEDVCLGIFMKLMGVMAIPLPRVSLPTPESVALLPDLVLCTEFHFRCKSQEIPRKDVEIMALLHERINNVCTNQTNQTN
jgi:hypothetical protein